MISRLIFVMGNYSSCDHSQCKHGALNDDLQTFSCTSDTATSLVTESTTPLCLVCAVRTFAHLTYPCVPPDCPNSLIISHSYHKLRGSYRTTRYSIHWVMNPYNNGCGLFCSKTLEYSIETLVSGNITQCHASMAGQFVDGVERVT